MKPLRTALFVPGNRPDRAAKALGLAAGAVILDLEDAVPFAEKEKTRTLLRELRNGSHSMADPKNFKEQGILHSYAKT